jgi:hypothetical protein
MQFYSGSVDPYLNEVRDADERRQALQEAGVVHVDCPHDPGYLFDCPACEQGACQCEGTDNTPCVSTHCKRGS